jgi:hypothetical protein
MASSSDARSTTSGGSAKKKGKDPVTIDVMLEQLDLQDEDFHDLVLDDVEQEIQASVQWMALARVQMEKGSSHPAFFGEMRAAWNPAQAVKFRAVGENLFTIQASCLAIGKGLPRMAPGCFETG